MPRPTILFPLTLPPTFCTSKAHSALLRSYASTRKALQDAKKMSVAVQPNRRSEITNAVVQHDHYALSTEHPHADQNVLFKHFLVKLRTVLWTGRNEAQRPKGAVA